MRILFVTNAPGFGGTEVYAGKVAKEIKRRGIEIHVVVHPSSRLLMRQTSVGIDGEPVGLGTPMGRARGWVGTLALLDPIARQALYTLLLTKRSGGFDNVIFQDPREQILGSRYAKQLGYRVHWIVHTPFHYLPHRTAGSILLRRSSRHAGRIIVVCEYLKERLASTGIPPDKLVVVPNFVDLDEVDNHSESAGPSLTTSRCVGYIGRLVHAKGVDVLVRAVAEAKRTDPLIRLRIVGDGRERPNLVRIVSRLGISGSTFFAGFVDNPFSAMAEMDLIVNPSRDPGEALPTNILEAFAGRKPVIATDHAGIPELVIPGVTGVLVPKDDVHGMANAILQLSADPVYASEIGRRARSFLSPKFLKSSVVDRLTEALTACDS